MLNNAKEATVDQANQPAADLKHVTTNMSTSILRALPTSARIQKAAPRANDFESFATSEPRTFTANTFS